MKPGLWWRLGALAAVLLAAGLRFGRLEAQSYWNDEGNSRVQAGRAWGEIVMNAAADIHPPGYYLALSVWRAGLGESEFGLRSFSALAGVLTVALTARLARRWGGWRASAVSAGLTAVHPLLIYYSQEARMYAWLTVWAVTAWLMLAQLLAEPRWGRVAAYAAVTAAGLYTHYAFGLVVAAQGVAVLGWLGWHRLRRRAPGPRLAGWLTAWLTAQAGAGLLFAPWLPTALHHLLTWPASRAVLADPLAMLTDLGRTLWLGRMVSLAESAPMVTALTGLGLAAWLRARPAHSGWALTWLAVPAGLTVAFGLLTEAFAKFLVVAAPPLTLLAGLAWPTAPRARPILPLAWLAVWLAALFPALNNLYFNPAYARDDYRAIARQVAALYRPGDAVALVSPNQAEAYLYYHTADAPVYPLPRTRPLDPAQTTADLAALARTHTRLFVLFWGEQQADPQGFIEGWLNANAFKAGDRWFGNVRLATYALAQPATAPQTPLRARFGEAILLTGYALNATTYAPGDIAQVTLFWQALAPLDTRYKVFVHVSPAFDEPPLTQHDGEPAGGSRPTAGWLPGEVIADNHGLLIPPDAPPGDYLVIVGVYGLFDGARLPTAAGDRLAVGRITLAAQP